MLKHSISCGVFCALTASTALAQAPTVEALSVFGQVICGHGLGGHVHAPVHTDDLEG